MENTAKIELNSKALLHNLSVVKKHAPSSSILAVVKSNAYGHGIKEVTTILNDVNAFGVGSIYEAIELRELGVLKPIVVMQGYCSTQEYEASIKYNLIYVLHNKEQLGILKSCKVKGQIFWIKIDTGMRLGFSPEFIKSNWSNIKSILSGNLIKVVMTHLSSADYSNKTYTFKQINCFEELHNEIDVEERSVCNSAGIISYPKFNYEWVRPGIMLYGISPFQNLDSKALQLQPVMNFISKIISISYCSKGDYIGYGATYRCPEDMPIGIVGAGYSHGYPQMVPPGTPIIVQGVKTSIVGRVSMAMLAVDLRNVKNVRVGSEVILWGEKLPIEEVSKFVSISTYELLTRVGNKVMSSKPEN